MNRLLVGLLGLAFLLPAALSRAQSAAPRDLSPRLETFGVGLGLNVTQTPFASPPAQVGIYVLRTRDTSPYDEVGFRLSLFARWQLGASRYFVQPELALTSSRGHGYFIEYYKPGDAYPNQEPFGHPLRRLDLVGLGGVRTSQRTYLMLGPGVAYNRRDRAVPVDPTRPVTELFNRLSRSVESWQLLGQVGVGYQAGRVDLQVRYEQNLTPFTKTLQYQGNSYGYRQALRQGLFSVAYQLHRPPASE
ncbi:hypothetical protein I2I05_09355 [Hymenobacter sp. BT683]|uniref:PorT family protein n=1 Tax=Hymenobacter jeongseonensis TaxID=2791027 RepID=A0ABS0IGX3_9BACT|nr:hypothetical protein [Hymenobacter jeongseonensis]MBF9237600.1 hypothetical protein [Hymenobacter jeongseonensis]